MNAVAAAPGARLRVERERQGLSIQKAADEMRLDAWVIEALETDQYERVGPAVYVRGHLKKYASILAIPGEEIVAGYESLRAAMPTVPPKAPAAGVMSSQPLVHNLTRGQIVAASFLMLLITGVLLWKPWQQRAAVAPPAAHASETPARGADAVPHDVTVPQASPASGSNAALGEGGASTANAPAATQGAGTTPPPQDRNASGTEFGAAPLAAEEPTATRHDAASGGKNAAPSSIGAAPINAGGGRASLRLSFSADSWVDVRDASGRRIFSGNGRANSVKTIAGEAPLHVYLGYASGVQLEVNAHAIAIGQPFIHGDVARFAAGADGVLRPYPNSGRPRG
jgi:cytoskeleton protein RodZ